MLFSENGGAGVVKINEDIEDVTSRYVHFFTEERNSDVVKRVHIKAQGHNLTQESQEMEKQQPGVRFCKS